MHPSNASSLNNDFLPPIEPSTLFAEWYALAQKHEPNDPNAMALATVDLNAKPSVRMVLMKGFAYEGISFYTNEESQKGRQLQKNPEAALCFHWKSIRRQVRFEGPVTRLSEVESDAYFASRPRGSQIGAWASQQSKTLESRAVLESAVHEFDEKFTGLPVPRPAWWGGYLLTPLAVEFWQDREFRLHDRILYSRMRTDGRWETRRLFP